MTMGVVELNIQLMLMSIQLIVTHQWRETFTKSCNSELFQ